MDKTKSPGISIELINLTECRVGDIDYNAGLEFHLGIAGLVRKESGDGLGLTVMAEFDLMQGVEKPPCTFRCAFIARYTRKADSNMTWGEFTDVMTVMHMTPYVREFISSVSLRLPIKELILPPTNVNALVADYKARQAVRAGSRKKVTRKPSRTKKPPQRD